ncbi:hypothetical protein MRBBS_3070 [Marinobacter sp. BSs20148]|nr:hypothetical protein MRBBS_3070 [Marinobacter sp. BSs20148]
MDYFVLSLIIGKVLSCFWRKIILGKKIDDNDCIASFL